MTGRDDRVLRARDPRASADRQQTLRRLVIAVAVAGVVAAVVDAARGRPDGRRRCRAWVPPALTILVVVASAAAVRVRLRSTVAVMTLDRRRDPRLHRLPAAGLGADLCRHRRALSPSCCAGSRRCKAAYNAGKDVLAATAGLVVAVQLGVADVDDPLARPGQVVLVAADGRRSPST